MKGNPYAISDVTELQRLLPYLRPYSSGIAAGLLMVLIANAFAVAVPYLIKQGIDALDAPGATAGVAFRYAALVVLVALLGGAARYAMRELLNGISRRVEYDLRRDFFAHLLRLDAGFYGRMATGDIMSRATNDLQAVRMVAGPAYMYLTNTVVVGVLAVTLMAWIDLRLTAIALIPMLLLPPATIFFGQAIHARFQRIQDQFGELSTMVQENLAGVRIVKAYTQEAAQVERFRGLSGEYLERNLALARVSGLFHPSLGLLSGLAMVLALWFGGAATMRGEISVGEFVAFGLYLAMLVWPMIALGWVVSLFQRGAASMGRLNRIFEVEPAITDPAEPVDLPTVRGEIELRNVSFRYPGTERWVLEDVSLTIPAGSTLAIVGPTGSGKSTLVNLFVRLHDPTEGEILVDGVPLRRIPLPRLRSLVGMVPQDPFLFSESIRANVAEGFEEPDEAALEERQQLAIARAFLPQDGEHLGGVHGHLQRAGPPVGEPADRPAGGLRVDLKGVADPRRDVDRQIGGDVAEPGVHAERVVQGGPEVVGHHDHSSDRASRYCGRPSANWTHRSLLLVHV
jgi:ATP-binding cassette, subfamily B, multidrug efflux pump